MTVEEMDALSLPVSQSQGRRPNQLPAARDSEYLKIVTWHNIANHSVPVHLQILIFPTEVTVEELKPIKIRRNLNLLNSILLKLSQDVDVKMEDYGDVPTLTIAPYQVLDNYWKMFITILRMKRGLEGNQKIGGKHRLLLQIHRTQETYQGNVLSGTFLIFSKQITNSVLSISLFLNLQRTGWWLNKDITFSYQTQVKVCLICNVICYDNELSDGVLKINHHLLTN